MSGVLKALGVAMMLSEVGCDEGAGGGLSRAAVATPPRRRTSALLLTLFVVGLACVLGLAGAGTALAQDDGAPAPQPNPQPAPPPDPQYPAEPVDDPERVGTIDGVCDSASGILTYTGEGWHLSSRSRYSWVVHITHRSSRTRPGLFLAKLLA